MEDSEILKLYSGRSENALAETEKKYGRYCYAIAHRILGDDGETEECVNETYFKAWNSIPPATPKILSVFLGKIVRNTALDLYEKKNRIKRGGGDFALVLDELAECADGSGCVESEIESRELSAAVREFLDGIDTDKRRIFILRYWYVMSVKEIAQRQGMKESNVKVTLHRLREQLRKELKEKDLM